MEVTAHVVGTFAWPSSVLTANGWEIKGYTKNLGKSDPQAFLVSNKNECEILRPATYVAIPWILLLG